MFPLVALDLIKVSSQYLSGGTALLIIVGVGLDTIKQIESQLRQHNYEGFLRWCTRPQAARRNSWNPAVGRGIEKA